MSFIQGSGLQHLDNISGATTFHMPGNFTSGNSAIFCVAAFLSGTDHPIASVIIGGTAASLVSINHTDANNSFEIWLAQSITGGVDTVVVTPGIGAGFFLSCACDEWSGFASTAFDVQATNTGTGLTPTVTSPALGQSSEVIYSLMGHGNGNNVAITQPAGWTAMFNEPNGNDEEPGAASYLIVSSASAVTANWSWGTSQGWQTAIATFKLGGGGGGVVSIPTYRSYITG